MSVNVKKCKTLEDALEQFCVVEKLEGENQYMVEHGHQNQQRVVRSLFGSC